MAGFITSSSGESSPKEPQTTPNTAQSVATSEAKQLEINRVKFDPPTPPAANVTTTTTTSNSSGTQTPAPNNNVPNPAPVTPTSPAATPNTTAATEAEPAATSPAPSQPATSKRLWNLENADIQAVIAAVSKETGKNFIIDPRVQGKITIVSTDPMAPDQVYQLFQSILQVLGFAAVPSSSGNVVKIVPDIAAREMGAPLSSPAHPGAGDELIAEVIPLRSASANQLVPILRPLMSQWSNISAYTPTNTLILAGRAGTIAHVVEIVKHMDKADTSQIEVIPMKYAAADKIVAAFTSLQNSDRALGKISNVSVAADPQSNSILISGDLESRILLHHLIAQLDTQRASGPTGNTIVIHLKYLKAKDLATMLGKVSQSAYVDATTPPGSPQQSSSANLNKSVSVQAEESTNSVVISAPPEIMSTLRSIVAQLDSRPRQVLVKAIIATVTETLARSLGIKWGTPNASSTSNNYDNGISNNTVVNNSPTTDIQQGVGVIPDGDLNVIISALQNDILTNILSTPSIMVLDNQEAILSNGQDVAQANRTYSQAGGTTPDTSFQPFTTVERRNVALTLKVTPHISPNNSVSLQIEQTDDSLASPAGAQNLYGVINTSKIKTTVLISSGDVLVLAGLTREALNNQVGKTPILGDIPVIGELFKQRDKRIEKSNLMVFIKPIIISSERQGIAVSDKAYNYIRNKQLKERHGESLIKTEDQNPILPPTKRPPMKKLPVPFDP